MPETAAAQLRRVLALVPELADDKEHKLNDVARRLGMDALTVLKDLESLATRFDEPGGFVEGVQVYLETDKVSLVSNHFRRPMRPTISELRALDLGLAMLRTEVPPDERSCIESARDKVRRTIGRLPPEINFQDTHYAESEKPASTKHLATLRAAFKSRRKVRIDYLHADREDVSARVIQPYSFVISSGNWYVIAYCEETQALRIVRLDRITRVDRVQEEYNVPENFRVSDAVSAHKALSATGSGRMRVKYSPRIARWIAEREEGELAPDGSFIVDHPLVDPDWGIRHVLQYGAEAEVLEPASLRDAIRAKLKRASELVSR